MKLLKKNLCAVAKLTGPSTVEERIEHRKKHNCTLKEKDLIHAVKSGLNEIKMGAQSILPCETYNAIEDNAPNLVFMHYKQVNKLQKLLAKHHCPEYLDEPAVERNQESEKRDVYVKLHNINSTVLLKEWLNAKKDIIELALGIKKNFSCQAKTRAMEDTLFACPDEALMVSGQT